MTATIDMGRSGVLGSSVLRSVVFIVLVFGLVACGGSDPTVGPTTMAPAGSAEWAVEYELADGAIVGVWGSAPDDVWAVGGQAGRGIILHSDGVEWVPVETGFDALLWWVYGFGRDDIYAVGEKGLIVHWDGVSWARVESGTGAPLYGLWGDGREVWIVGGEPNVEQSAVILRGQGRTFAPVADLPSELRPNALYKVYGSPTHEVIAVGTGGTVLRHDGLSWTRDDVPTQHPIVSLWGRGEHLYAVGGASEGEMLHHDGERWRSVGTVMEGPGLFGVYTQPDAPVIAVGAGPRVVELSPGAPALEIDSTLDPSFVLHSVWGDGAGSVYAVGGSLMRYPKPMSGVIVRRR